MKDIISFCPLKKHETSPCSIFFPDESCTIHLKVSAFIEDPKPIQDHDVPVFVHDKPKQRQSHWDLTTQQVIQTLSVFNPFPNNKF